MIMNVNEVTFYLQEAPGTIYGMTQQGKILYGNVGRAWRFHKEAIDWSISGNTDTLIGLGAELIDAE